MRRHRSPRQRRDTARRRCWQREAAELEARLAPLREEIAATRPATLADLLARQHGASAVPVWLRHGRRGVAVIGDGWRVVGPLEAVRAELEHRAVSA